MSLDAFFGFVQTTWVDEQIVPTQVDLDLMSSCSIHVLPMVMTFSEREIVDSWLSRTRMAL